MLRPASRRAGRRNAPASGPQPYGPQPYEPAATATRRRGPPAEPSPHEPYGTSRLPTGVRHRPTADRQRRAGRRADRAVTAAGEAPARPRPDPPVLPAAHGPGHPGPDRRVLLLGRLLRRAGADRARRRLDLRQAGRMGPGPLPGPGGDVRRVDHLQPAQGGRQAGLLAGRAVRRRAGQELQAHARLRAEHPGRSSTSPAGKPLPGEGAWRVLETVKGYPAIFGTFLRPSAVYTSYVAGHRLDGPAAGQVPAAAGRRGPGPG